MIRVRCDRTGLRYVLRYAHAYVHVRNYDRRRVLRALSFYGDERQQQTVTKRFLSYARTIVGTIQNVNLLLTATVVNFSGISAFCFQIQNSHLNFASGSLAETLCMRTIMYFTLHIMYNEYAILYSLIRLASIMITFALLFTA